eukprot:CAMPEP_0172825932 /NCGR_PEP_ID=MMETSP1075-20121228/19055_1 /TAXON_ID=2916 /ORGANISM="Ceratium fusus, Strain PA161109" /LENGTH=187 /DNA_ID=CAMNT_0013667481 /DNA_START=1 /DNA_END=561 /DNA_ORIENTATION=-
MIFHACGGGTDYGLSCLKLERLSVDYGKTSKLSCNTWACPLVANAVVESYNTALCVHSLKVEQTEDVPVPQVSEKSAHGQKIIPQKNVVQQTDEQNQGGWPDLNDEQQATFQKQWLKANNAGLQGSRHKEIHQRLKNRESHMEMMRTAAWKFWQRMDGAITQSQQPFGEGAETHVGVSTLVTSRQLE